MIKIANPDRLYRRLTPSEWAYAVDQYELGYQSGRSIARKLGVSNQAMSRGLTKRGAIKGARAHETVIELNEMLDERDRIKRLATAKLWEQAAVQLLAIKKFIHDFAIALGEPVYARALIYDDIGSSNSGSSSKTKS